MEFRVVGHASPPSDHPGSHKWCGSVGHNNGDIKPTKVAKLSDDSSSPFKNSSSFGYCDGQQQHNMLSFTSPKFENKNLQSTAFSFYSKSSGNSFSTGNVNGVRGPFTASQWLELEQQALIYKHIIANEPVPYNLLMPIRRAFQSAGFCNFLGGLLRSNTIGYGWGPLYLGVGNTTDPEPGRCRRTDGKKWRCSKEALPDHKYCERHMNRGRHRSRKPVEGHSAISVSGASTNNISTMANCSEDGPSNKFARNVDQNKDLLNHGHSFHLPSTLLKRYIEHKDDNSQSKQDAVRLDLLSPKIGLNTSGNALSFSKSAADDFSFRTSDAILSTTTTPKGSSTLGAYGHSHNFYTPRSEPLHSPRSFMEDRSSILWPKMHTQTEKSQLSISIPPSDLMTSTSSPTREVDTLSPLRLSRELGLVQTGFGVGLNSWENSSMGGPLGEVLKTTSASNNSSGSLQLASSPTGVLHRTALGYFSNSSAGSSPRAEHGHINDSIGFTLGSSSFLPL